MIRVGQKHRIQVKYGLRRLPLRFTAVSVRKCESSSASYHSYSTGMTDTTRVTGSGVALSSCPHGVCPWYLGYLLASPLRRLLENPERMLRPYVRPGMTVLEPGSGMGFFSLPLARLVGAEGRVVCVDLAAADDRRPSTPGAQGRTAGPDRDGDLQPRRPRHRGVGGPDRPGPGHPRSSRGARPGPLPAADSRGAAVWRQAGHHRAQGPRDAGAVRGDAGTGRDHGLQPRLAGLSDETPAGDADQDLDILRSCEVAILRSHAGRSARSSDLVAGHPVRKITSSEDRKMLKCP